MSDKYLTVKQAAEECGISENAIKRYCKTGEIKASEVASNKGRYGWKYMIKEDDLYEWVMHRDTVERTHREKKIVKQAYRNMSLEEMAGELLNRNQSAYKAGYDDGYKAGITYAKQEMLKAIKEVKL